MTNRLRSLFLILSSFCLAACTESGTPAGVSSPSPSAAADVTMPEAKSERTDDVYIFYTSDVHCGVDENITFAGLKALVDETKAEHPDTLLVDCGDFLQGGSLGSLTRGEAVIELMNKMEYDVVALGNHDFDYGIPRLKELIGKAEFPVVSANITYTGSGTNQFADLPGYVIKEAGGTKIAFIGITTPFTLVDSTPAFFKEDGEFVYDFNGGDDGTKLAALVQETVNEARAAGAEYVIALAHLGSAESYRPFDSIGLVHRTEGIDAVIDGHAHSVIIGDAYPNKNGDDVMITSVGTKMENVGIMILSEEGEISTTLISESNKKDEKMAAEVKAVYDSLNAMASEVITETEFDVTIADENGTRIVRTREAPCGDLVTDAFRTMFETQIAMANGGGVRAAIPAGTVTYQNLINIMPFGNSISSFTATGQQILDVLEFGSRFTERLTSFDGQAVGESGGFLQVSGLKYTIDTSIPSPVLLDANNMFDKIDGERRVKDVQVLQEDGTYVPIDPEATYSVAGPDYIIWGGGDGNTVFEDCVSIRSDGDIDVNVLRQYIEKCEGIPEEYRETHGRITVE